MKLLVLVAALGMTLAGDAALAQGRGGDSGRTGGGGAVVGARGGPGGAGGQWSGYRGGGNPGGWHGGYSGRWYGSGWYGGGYRGWYGPRVGIYLGGPAYWGTWPYAYYGAYPGYYPYPVYVPSEPPAYVEQSPQGAPTATENYWYYCQDPAGYYPYVQHCSKAWMTVVPQRGPNPPSPLPPAQ